MARRDGHRSLQVLDVVCSATTRPLPARETEVAKFVPLGWREHWSPPCAKPRVRTSSGADGHGQAEPTELTSPRAMWASRDRHL